MLSWSGLSPEERTEVAKISFCGFHRSFDFFWECRDTGGGLPDHVLMPTVPLTALLSTPFPSHHSSPDARMWVTLTRSVNPSLGR